MLGNRPGGGQRPGAGERPGGGQRPGVGDRPTQLPATGRPGERPPGTGQRPPGTGQRPPGTGQRPPGQRPPGYRPGHRPIQRPPGVRPPGYRPPGSASSRLSTARLSTTAPRPFAGLRRRLLGSASPLPLGLGQLQPQLVGLGDSRRRDRMVSQRQQYAAGLLRLRNQPVLRRRQRLLRRRSVCSSEEYATQAQTIATSVPEVQPDKVEWLPLGVFALTESGGSAEDSTLFLQLAISKEGIIAGTFQNTATDTSFEVEGTIDNKSQRAAWGPVGENWPIMETGVYNLTENEAGALLHFEDGQTQQWTMVRLDDPENASEPEN